MKKLTIVLLGSSLLVFCNGFAAQEKFSTHVSARDITPMITSTPFTVNIPVYGPLDLPAVYKSTLLRVGSPVRFAPEVCTFCEGSMQAIFPRCRSQPTNFITII